MSRTVPRIPAGRDVLVLGLQYGDEGKGRVVDNLAAEEESVVIRYAGGPNAGHTVVTDGTVHRFHGLPSGFAAGREGIIGGGCVVNLDTLAGELEAAPPGAVLRISSRAHAIMPYHLVQDAAEEAWRHESTTRLGTTGRGIGPAYADKAARTGLRLGDLLLGRRGEDLARRYVAFKRRLVERCLDQPALLDEPGLDAGHVTDSIRRWRHFADLLIDDEAYLVDLRARGDVRLIFEGAQAFGLDLEYGRYPFVSSSVNSVAGAIAGGARAPYVLGVTKCYTIAVGEGPMPTELNGDVAQAIRERGLEFGTTTGRARRIGWLDLPLLRRAVRVNGVDGICLTNLDVVAGFDRLAMATEYLSNGRPTAVSPFLLDAWQDAVPVLEEHAAWPALDGVGGLARASRGRARLRRRARAGGVRPGRDGHLRPRPPRRPLPVPRPPLRVGMANHHHGNVGDVVKHLVLGEALVSERPGRYLESHAGDTDYPLPWPRFADVQAFRVACERDGELRATTYAAALAAAPDRSPGSVALAARALPDAQLLAWDLDAGSVDSLRSLDGGRIRAHAADGLNGVLAEARPGDVAFLDPFDPRLGDAVSVFSTLAARGVRTAFWYATGPGAPLAAPPAATRIEVTVPPEHVAAAGLSGCGMAFAGPWSPLTLARCSAAARRAAAAVPPALTCTVAGMEDESVVLVDVHDEPLATAPKLDTHRSGALHRAVSAVVLRSDGRLLLQRRADGKYHSPGRWSNASCTHPRLGESPADAARRRLLEELGFECPLEPAGTVRYRLEVGDGLIEHELDHVFVGRYDGTPLCEPGEASHWAAVAPGELERRLAAQPDAFTPWLRPVLDTAGLA